MLRNFGNCSKENEIFDKVYLNEKLKRSQNSETENGTSAIGINDSVLETNFYGKAKYEQYGNNKNVQKWRLLLSKLADRSNVWTT